MGRAVPVTVRPAHAASAAVGTMAGGRVARERAMGTTYEMCLCLDQGAPKLERQFRRLVEAIVGQFPPEQGATVLLAGTGASGHLADVAGPLARHLTAVCSGSVILVDADSSDRVLSYRLAAKTEPGLAETIRDHLPASRFALWTAVPRLAFLPFGDSVAARQTMPSQVVRDIVAAWKADYRYSVVVSGARLTKLTGWLSRFCDATYLVMQLGRADKQEASFLARALTAAGARIMGSVATGVGA